MRVYIAGRIKNRKDYFDEFAKASALLRMGNYDVFNPAAANLEGVPLNRIMARLLPQLCECGAIAMLPGWYWSGGARIEWLLARYLGLEVIYMKR